VDIITGDQMLNRLLTAASIVLRARFFSAAAMLFIIEQQESMLEFII
jgi:hypothetical protein